MNAAKLGDIRQVWQSPSEVVSNSVRNTSANSYEYSSYSPNIHAVDLQQSIFENEDDQYPISDSAKMAEADNGTCHCAYPSLLPTERNVDLFYLYYMIIMRSDLMYAVICYLGSTTSRPLLH